MTRIINAAIGNNETIDVLHSSKQTVCADT